MFAFVEFSLRHLRSAQYPIEIAKIMTNRVRVRLEEKE